MRSILQHNLYINDVFFRSAKVAVIAIANIWFGVFYLIFGVYDMERLLVASELE